MYKNYFFELNKITDNKFMLCDRKDPDSDSKSLYEDFISAFLNKKLPNGESIEAIEIVKRNNGRSSWWEVKTGVGICKVGLGMDYIGPSIYWAQKAGLEDNEILDFIKESRTLGGHLIWPRWIFNGTGFQAPFYSINNARGGKEGVFDRIDFTLLYLKQWFEGNNCKLYEVYKTNKMWLESFLEFKKFLEYFCLEGFVYCDEQGVHIKNLSSFDEENNSFDELLNDTKPFIPAAKDEYLRYIKGCNYIINARTSKFI